jgi:arylsulfatase A
VWAYYNAINEARVAMRHGKWKVLAKLNGGKLSKMPNVTRENLHAIQAATLTDIELYDLTKDIAESVNVADEDPARTAKLKATLEHEYRELVKGSHVW